MPEKLSIEFPSQGWRQILTARKAILDAYDNARQLAKGRKVETSHGNTFEAAFRKWLQEFLPKRYGVTSGFVVSSGQKSGIKTPHFDVIIYDQLNSPVLWIEGNPDASPQGRPRAIPVEYVCAVLEVKSSFSSVNVKRAIEHLADLSPLLGGLDLPTDRYKLHLPPTFRCGLLFGEAHPTAMHSEAALKAVIAGACLRGFFGGLILRAEGDNAPRSGRIELLESRQPFPRMFTGRRTSISAFATSSSHEFSENCHIGAMTKWQEMNFAGFAFDLVAMLQGTYVQRRLSSFYGVGDSSHEGTVS
jgi:hypothetical protein